MLMKTLGLWASPRWFNQWIPKLQPFILGLGALTLAYGLIGGLLLAPPDYQQGEGFRIIYVHVPCAVWSMLCYLALGLCAFLALVFHLKIPDHITRAIAPVGALMTALALATGSLWGQPMWGTWWIWDARLTSELMLLLLYLGIISLRRSIPDPKAAAHAAHLLALIGLINLPIIHYSVVWWHTLHQGATLKWIYNASIDASMLQPLLSMWVAAGAYCAYTTLARTLTLLQKGTSPHG